ncbi:MAG: Ig-like domain-containing protein, partial [Verrucomicrobiota bacterium]
MKVFAACAYFLLLPATKYVFRVAQICNLLYRRIAFCGTSTSASPLELSDTQPITNRRYGRLQICATTPRCALNTYTTNEWGDDRGEGQSKQAKAPPLPVPLLHRMEERELLRLRLCRAGVSGLAAVLIGSTTVFAQAPLTTLEYRIVGTQLTVTPAALSVPKNIAGSVLVTFTGPANSLAGAYVEATLRGPSFAARRIVGQVNQPLLLPALPLVGDYQLDNIRLVDAVTGETKMEATPSSVPVRVFDEVLVSRVTSRPLTLAEIQDKGIVIDDANFRAVEFEVGFVLDGRTIPVRFPVISPAFKASTELIPKAELEKKLAEAAILNQEIAATVELPPELEQSKLNIQITGINFQFVDVGESDIALRIPPIPALMVIPGNIGFLNQFFSVQIFTENGAPGGSGLSVNNVQAKLILPPGPDRIASTNYNQPGDDPLRFARVGTDKIIQPTQTITRPGPDGKTGTPDDILRLQSGDSGTAEFLVEGLQEGLHVMDLDLTADLEGLAAGVVKVSGKAAGSVLVRNPKFSLAFSHPRTIRAGEPYDASVTILNTSISPANLVRVTLPATALSGGVLESPETVELGTILPGETATAKYRVRSQRTGAISFSNLTTSDESTAGRFRLSMGIDERGVVLSPDTIAMPDFANALPSSPLDAANRVLGQALSVATAGQLPAGTVKVPKSIITKRVLELAEAGQRLRYGDSTNRVLADLLLDWQGGRNGDVGFDQILRVTDAGREFREALMAEVETADALDGAARLVERAPDLTGRGEAWALASVNLSGIELSLNDGTNSATLDHSDVVRALAYRGGRGHWLAAGALGTNTVFKWTVTNTAPSVQLAALLIGTNGTARQFRWTVANPPAGSCYSFAVADASGALLVDSNCDGTPESSLPATIQNVAELPPQVVAVLQDPSVHAGRPFRVCFPGVPIFPQNYATVLAVLFSKPMTAGGVNVPAAYALENGNRANSVQIQPGGRVALLNMARPVGAIRPRTMTVRGVSDPRGNAVAANSKPVLTELRAGTAIRGRVVRADGSVATAVPVTLTYYDLDGGGVGCQTFIARVSQVFTDLNGSFEFDFVLSGIPYSVSATDTTGLPPEAIQAILESASGDAFAREKLIAQLNTKKDQDSLLTSFGTANLPEAIAKAEGIDRALQRDLVPLGSAREGAETIVALRFRGRAVVNGQVLAADGATPVSGVAVNLFPDPDSRELGRGILSDSSGRFAFFGVPLGLFTVQATAPSGQFRTVAGVLDTGGETRNLSIVLSSNVTTPAALRGRVFEPDTITSHPNARVFVGRFNEQNQFVDVVAAVTADADGFWVATNFPANTYDVAAVSFDGKRKGDRRGIQATLAIDTQVNIALNGRTTVSGRVEFFNGVSVANALVAGGDSIVRTDAQGLFTLTGVPTGRRSIEAGLEKNPAAGIDFTRLGSVSINVVAGLDNFAVIRLNPAGRITGRVLDALGQPVPNLRVAIPVLGGFLWTDADGSGNYVFYNLGLDEYTLSAPGPEVAKTDTSEIADRIFGGSSAEINAALGEAFKIFVGATDPFLTGEPFNPKTWGFTRTRLTFDGQTVVADIRFLRPGTVSGTVLNGQAVPIGAKVRLTGIGPLANGAPSFIIRGDANSDPALGTFEFKNALLVGDFGLQAASPFFPVVITTSGKTTSTEPNSTNNILQFPATREINGRLTGTVFNPNGSRAGSNVIVKISFGTDYSIKTGTNGFFDTQIGLPAGGYTVEVNDPLSGLKGQSIATVLPGITNVANVQLIGKGALTVLVKQANGAIATNATVEIRLGAFPNDTFTGNTGTNGTIVFQNIFAGPYAVCGSILSGPTTIFGRAGATVIPTLTSTVTVTLGPTATIRGTFVQRDRVTPVGFAQVTVGSIGFATTDAAGKFEIAGIPLGTYRLVTQNQVTGVGAVANVTLEVDGEIRDVLLVEQARGEIQGFVINGYGTGFVPGANVKLKVSEGFMAERAVTTGPDGAFSFPGTAAGNFTLEAEDPVTKFKGNASGTLAENASALRTDVPLQPLALLAGTVFEPDGVTPATNATVRLTSGGLLLTTDTDSTGRVAFVDLPLGNYTLRADSRRTGATHSAGTNNIALNLAGTAPDFGLRLLGVGSVAGAVFLANGTTPANGAEVILRSQAALSPTVEETKFTDAAGGFSFGNVAVGPYTLSVKAVALGASGGGSIAINGEIDTVRLVLGASGAVVGRLVRADGTNAVAGVDTALTFNSQSGLPGIAVSRSDSNGTFAFANIPVGAFDFEAIASSFGGLARFTSLIAANGQTNNLGDVRFDEDDPRVVSVLPAHTTVGISIAATVTLVFNEALATNSLSTNGIFIRLSGSATNLPATLDLIPDRPDNIPRLVRITPSRPLLSEKTYEVVVVDGERKDALGGVIARGPNDLVGRPLTAPFVSQFTTADNDPPVLVSIFPSNNTVQIDPRSVPRLSFNEPVRSTGFVFAVTGPGGEIAGTTSGGLNGLVLNFTPAVELPPNATYTITVSNVLDLAGNRATNEPFVVKFNTIDSLGPNVATLRIADGKLPVAGSTVPVEALLAANEPGVAFRFTQELNPIPATGNRASVALPASGSTTVRAIATDQFGNDGPFGELTINVTANTPPTVSLARGTPASGSLTNGQAFTLRVSGQDDVAVTNITVVGLGAVSFATNLPTSGQQLLSFVVPANAVPGGLFQFRAQATDALGAKSTEAVIDFEIIDGVPPAVAILSPPENALLNAAQPLNLVVRSADNGANHRLELTLTGGVTGTQSINVTSPSGALVTNTFVVSLANAPTNGATVTATIRAIDSSTNTTTVARTFRLPDRVPPQLLSASPTNSAIGQSLWLSAATFDFDQPLDPFSTTNNVAVTSSTGAPPPFVVSLANGNRRLQVVLEHPLIPGATYT